MSGCVAFAKHVGPERAEAELLPQCWEQITHKFQERRQLVAESCGALAPYLPVFIIFISIHLLILVVKPVTLRKRDF